MSPDLVAGLLLAAAYFVGAIPFGYLIGKARGVDLFKVGSGNIGATNAARALGKKFGFLVFALDFLKGAVPVAAIVPLAKAFDADTAFGTPDVLRVGAAALAFLGHIFPIYLGFSGGKGVATGAGTLFVLVPGPATLTILYWAVILLASGRVSVASIGCVVVLILARLLGTPDPFSPAALPITLYLLAGSVLVWVKHRSNMKRLIAGTEVPNLGDGPRREFALRAVHLVALGVWFGGARFFNFLTAPAIFASFKEVVANSPSDRTANVRIVPPGTSDNDKDALANALAGSAVGPVFPRYFGMQIVCGVIALVTALQWWKLGRVHRVRGIIVAAALASVAIGLPISDEVSRLRPLRFATGGAQEDAARASFAAWHLVSLGLSFVTVLLAGAALALAAKLPNAKSEVVTK
jgi:acyl-phosphate glycerol 3-phosphate acyltransferase